jgi:hypothetical protein
VKALKSQFGEARNEGLIPRVGRYMRNAIFVVFAARKSADFLAE